MKTASPSTCSEQQTVDRSGTRKFRPLSDGHALAFDAKPMLPTQDRVRRTEENFWAAIDRNGPTVRPDLGPCWLWTKRCARDGYGLVSFCGVDRGAHRVAWSLKNGEIPAGMVIMHRCDNPPCCNPAHLVLGTVAENVADMIRKGRRRLPQAWVHRGANNANSKLTEDLVREYRIAWRAGESLKSIVKRSGLSVGTIHPMLHGKTWKHVDDGPDSGARAAAEAFMASEWGAS